MHRRRLLRILIALAFAVAIFAVYLYAGNGRSIADPEPELRSKILENPGDSSARIELGLILAKKTNWTEAILTLQDGLKLTPNDIALNRQLAIVYGDWFKSTRNLKHLSRAGKYLQQVLDSGQATVDDFKMMAEGQYAAGDYVRAADAYDEAAKRDPQDSRQLQLARYAGYMAGQYEKSLAFFKDLTESEPKNDWAWQTRGIVEYYVGNYDEAVSSLKKSVDLATSERRKSARDNLAYALQLQSKEKTAANFYAHYGFADTHFKKSRIDRAAAEYEAAVNISTDFKREAAWAYARMADFAEYMSKYDQALEYSQKAIEFARQTNNYDDMSFKYQQLAGIYARVAIQEKDKFGEYLEKAIEAAERQLDFCRRAGNGHMEIHAVSDLARYLRKKDGVDGERTKAFRAEMAKYLPKEGQALDCATASVLEAEGWFCHDERNFAEAEKRLKPAAEYFARGTDVRIAKAGPSLYTELGKLAYQQNDFDRGIRYAERSVELLNRLRSLLGADEFRQQFGGDTWQDAFLALITCAFKKNDSKAIFNYTEQYKAQALLELLGTRAETKKGKERLLLAKHEAADPSDPAVDDSSKAPSATRDLSIEQSHYPRLPEDTSTARRSIQTFERAISFGADEIQKMATDFTFVSYGITDEGSLAVVLSGDTIETVELPVTLVSLREAVEAFRDGLGLKQGVRRDLSIESDGTPPKDSGDREKALKEASAKLWDMLIEPVKPHLQTNLVYICPDGLLNYLPFEAFEKNGRYLVQDFAIAYAPSATVLKYCMDQQRTRRESLLALGNPNLQNPAFRLINAEDEVQSLKELFPHADVFVGNDANERTLLERSPQYDVLHFACHGELNIDEPMLTALRLAPDEQNDGYLHAGEIFDLDLDASLVVLSACNTGLGAIHSGNELMGLTRSFLYAGSSSIVASLWTVDDRSTALLMRAFYRNLATMNKAEALRQAKLETLKEFPNPFHWAAFCLQGDYR